jgi:hypothetical protein
LKKKKREGCKIGNFDWKRMENKTTKLSVINVDETTILIL